MKQRNIALAALAALLLFTLAACGRRAPAPAPASAASAGEGAAAAPAEEPSVPDSSGSVCSGTGIRSLKPVRNSGGRTSSKGRILSLSLPPMRRS